MATDKTRAKLRPAPRRGNPNSGVIEPNHAPVEPDDPWPVDLPSPPCEPCKCESPAPEPPVSETPEPHEPIRSRDDECCRQIFDLLRCLFPDQPRCFSVRKPKTPVKVKAANLCGALPIKDRLAPSMMLILRRHREGVPSGNPFETEMRVFLDGLPARQLTALRRGLDAYDKLPRPARDCIYETRFDDWPDGKPVNPEFIGKNLGLEIATLGRVVRHGPAAGATPKPGRVRPWEQTFPAPGEPGKLVKQTAPWPWICAVNPLGGRADGEGFWFKNLSSLIPDKRPPNALKFEPHEFAWECVAGPKPNSQQLTVSCKPGGFSQTALGGCLHGFDYDVSDNGERRCLRVPSAHLGTEIGLRGFNFFSRQSRVLVRHVDGKFTRFLKISDLEGDPEHTTDNIASCIVRDVIFFRFPARVPDKDGNDVQVPAGMYRISVEVQNIHGFATTLGEPSLPWYRSNEVLVEMLPQTTLNYDVHCTSARCDEETSGLGSDEVLFRSFSVVAQLPQDDKPVSFTWTKPTRVLDAGDVDSGEWISIDQANKSLFSGKIGRNQAMAIGLIGLEVDDRDLAEKEINDWETAFFEFFQRWFGVSASGAETGAVGKAAIAVIEGAANQALWVGVAGLGAMLLFSAAAFWADWERADVIAYDMIPMTSVEFFKLTEIDPTYVRTPETSFIRGLRQVYIDVEPILPKTLAPGGQYAVYRETHVYRSPIEGSRYKLVYEFTRTDQI